MPEQVAIKARLYYQIGRSAPVWDIQYMPSFPAYMIEECITYWAAEYGPAV